MNGRSTNRPGGEPTEGLVFFGIDARIVDQVFDRLAVGCWPTRRVIVFDIDMALLGALVRCWAPTVPLTIACMPADGRFTEVAVTIVESEGCALARTLWVHAGQLDAGFPGLTPLAVAPAASADLIAQALRARLDSCSMRTGGAHGNEV